MSSLSAYSIIISTLFISSFVWYLRIEIESRSIRLLASLIALSTQILLEVYLTFDHSPLRLSHLPFIHFIILAGIAISAQDGIKKVYRDRNSFKLLHRSNWTNVYSRYLFKTYWFFIPFLTALLIGVYPALLGGPSTVDERAYHWPQILGIVQNNGFSKFDSSLPWTYTYPLGKASLSAFSWPFVQTDLAFRAIQLLFALIAILSIYIIGKYLSRSVGIISALVITASPVFSVMLRMSSDDLGYGSFVLAATALLVQANISDSKHLRQKLFCYGLICVSLSGQFKFPVVSIILTTPLIIRFIFSHKQVFRTYLIYFGMTFIAFSLGLVYSIRNYFEYRNPFYPMTVEIGKRTIFNGPLISINNETIRPSTTFSIEEPFRLLKIWHATFFDIFQLPNEDSLGSYNYLVGILLLATFMYGLTKLGSLNAVYKLLLFSNLLVALAIPGVFHPRYGFFVVAIFVIFSLNAISTIISRPKEFTFLILATLIGLAPIYRSDISSKNWISSQSGGDLYKNGQSYIDRQIDLTSDGTVLPAKLVKWIQETVTEKELVCYSAATNYPSAYWNLDRTSFVRYSPVLQLERYPNANNNDLNYKNKDVRAWFSRNVNCDYLVTYAFQDIEELSKKDWQKSKSDETRNIWILERRK